MNKVGSEQIRAPWKNVIVEAAVLGVAGGAVSVPFFEMIEVEFTQDNNVILGIASGLLISASVGWYRRRSGGGINQ